MIFKNKKERTNWIIATVYILISLSRLNAVDFNPQKISGWSAGAVSTLIAIHIYAALTHRNKGATVPGNS